MKKYKETKKEYSRKYREEHPDKVAAYNKATVAERASRNKARAEVADKLGKAAIRGKDVHHKDSNPLNNSGKNLAVKKAHHEGGVKGNKNARKK
jgi:hypothetical protein